MKGRVTVVGSGVSGVHFAWSLLEQGWGVTLVDVGHEGKEYPNPEDDLAALRRNLDDPTAWFLGRDFEGLILPGHEGEYYGFPPSKEHVFRPLAQLGHRNRGFEPLFSYAQGGLAEAWTAGSYAYTDAELAEWPVDLSEFRKAYDLAGRRVGISGRDDDLTPFYPLHAGLQGPVEPDAHSRLLLETYERRKQAINRLGAWVGSSRYATIAEDLGDRKGCSQLGRCLWGCPTGALWTPALTLQELRKHPDFDYRPGLVAQRFSSDDGGRIRSLVTRDVAGGREEEHPVEQLALAAGTLSSARIFLASWKAEQRETPELRGLMDNRQVMMPFVNLKMLGRPFEGERYQYHQVAIVVDDGQPQNFVHCQVTSLTTALAHPLVQSLPLDFRTSIRSFAELRCALGLVNLNFVDTRRDENRVTLDEDDRLVVDYSPPGHEDELLAHSSKTLRKVLRKLGCIAPKGQTHTRPMGSSVHYAGLIPLAEEGGSLTATPEGRSRDFENLWLVDGITFPTLPAKNLSFTLMANAARVARSGFS